MNKKVILIKKDMPDKINEKIISIFAKHKKQTPLCDDEKIVRSKDGFYYVCTVKDDNGNNFDENKIIDKSNKTKYIIKIMIEVDGIPYIYNFLVSGEKILEFLSPYILNKKDGKVIDIDKYYPEDLA